MTQIRRSLSAYLEHTVKYKLYTGTVIYIRTTTSTSGTSMVQNTV
jgi:hypothetical protein